MSMDLSWRHEGRLRREATLTFREGDPGKRVDAHLPTPAWKMLTEAAQSQGLTIGHAAATALAEWAVRNV